MDNKIGIGVLGTFAQPFGYQQKFYLDVRFDKSLDLKDDAILLYPGSEIISIKKTVENGIYSICFTIYSCVKDTSSDGRGAFIGTCVVLQNAFTSAENIYKLLSELHYDTITNIQNIADGVIEAPQVSSIIVREPSQFKLVKSATYPIDQTPFNSLWVDGQKKYLIIPDGEDDRHGKVLEFFDRALKYFKDTDALYFTFDNRIINDVNEKKRLHILGGQEFVHFEEAPRQEFVRTKKQIKKAIENNNETVAKVPEVNSNTAAVLPQELPVQQPVTKEQTVEELPVQLPVVEEQVTEESPVQEPVIVSEPIAEEPKLDIADEINDVAAPRDQEEATIVNDVINNVAAIQDVHEDALPVAESQDKKEKIQEPALIEEITTDHDEDDFLYDNDHIQQDRYAKVPFFKRRAVRLVIAVVILVALIGIVLYIAGDNGKQAAKAPTDTAAKTKVADNRLNRIDSLVKKVTDTTHIADSTRKVDSIQQAAVAVEKHKELNPRPNMELSAIDIINLRNSGNLKYKLLPDLVRIIYDKYPGIIGGVYRDQENEYAKKLLSANKGCFQKVGEDYVYAHDSISHIPAYKSTRQPVVAPK